MTSATRPSPRLTIVIPTVNRASLVGRAIDSALAQTYPKIEIIVSNNGSTDGTRSVLDRYEGSPRLRIFHQPETVPVDAHGAILLKEVAGEFAVALSDDDWLEPGFAAKVVSFYDHHPPVSFVWTGSVMHYAGIAVPAETGPELESGTEFMAAFLAGRRDPCWCACVMRTADLRRLLPHPPEVICGDIYCWIKLASAGNVGCVPDFLAHYTAYRDRGDGMAGGASVLVWAREMAGCAREIVAACESDALLSNRLKVVRRDAAEFVARSTANQFVWNRLRGVGPVRLLQSLLQTLRFLRGGSPSSWIRVMASLIAPRWLLRKGMIEAAKLRVAGFSASGRG